MTCTCEPGIGVTGSCHGMAPDVAGEACEVCTKLYAECTCDECDACGLMVAEKCGTRDQGLVFCDSDCESNYGERAHERMLSDYYGGSAPFNDRERADVARAVGK